MKAGPVKFDYKGMQNNKHVAVIIHKDPNAVLHFEVGNILWPMDIAAVTRLEAVSPMAVKKI